LKERKVSDSFLCCFDTILLEALPSGDHIPEVSSTSLTTPLLIPELSPVEEERERNK
jgi:hypothetical protein